MGRVEVSQKELRHFWQKTFRNIAGYSEAPSSAMILPPEAPIDFYKDASYVSLLQYAEKNGAIALPQSLKDSVSLQSTVEAMRQKARKEILGDILEWGQEKNCPILPLKGAQLAFSVWPDENLRMMGDLDIMTSSDCASVLIGKLAEWGFEPQSNMPDNFYSTHHHKLPMKRAADGVVVEIHTKLLAPSIPEAMLPVFSSDSVWKNSAEGMLLERPCTLLDPVLNWYYVLLHGMSELKIYGGIFPVLDLVFLLRQDQIDKERFMHFASRYPRIEYITRLYFGLLRLIAGRDFVEWLIPEKWEVKDEQVGLRQRMALRDYIYYGIWGLGDVDKHQKNHHISNRLRALAARRLSSVSVTDLAASYIR